jgi:branched-chain amino acid transport system ATP-binding protein
MERRMMLEIESVTVGYNAIPVLRDVTIRVQAGQLVAVVGPNGAGKSTLFKTISGVLTPSSGSLRFEGVDIRNIPAAQRAPGVSVSHGAGEP